MLTYKTDGSRIIVTINLKQYLFERVQVPIKDVKYRIEGDYIIVEAEIDIDRLMSMIG